MKSYIVLTDNSEEVIEEILNKILPLKEKEELILFDNLSEDETISKIISTIDLMCWVDKESRYKFYINSKKETKEETLNKAIKVAKGEPIVIDKETEINAKEVVKC